MLRVSSEEGDLDLGAITEGPREEEIGVPYGNELIAYADAVVARSPDVVTTRDAVQQALGNAGVVGAAAVIASFQRMVRIADGIGINIDQGLELASADFREEIGINRFASAEGRGRGT